MKTPQSMSAQMIPMEEQANSEPVGKPSNSAPLKKDTWVFKGREFRMVEGEIPGFIATAFEKPASPSKVVPPYEYDRSKLSVYCLSGVSGADLGVRVELVDGPLFIADVIPKADAFKIQVYPTGQGIIPMSTAEFLRAIHAAKLNLFLKTDDSDNDGR